MLKQTGFWLAFNVFIIHQLEKSFWKWKYNKVSLQCEFLKLYLYRYSYLKPVWLSSLDHKKILWRTFKLFLSIKKQVNGVQYNKVIQVWNDMTVSNNPLNRRSTAGLSKQCKTEYSPLLENCWNQQYLVTHSLVWGDCEYAT